MLLFKRMLSKVSLFVRCLYYLLMCQINKKNQMTPTFPQKTSISWAWSSTLYSQVSKLWSVPIKRHRLVNDRFQFPQYQGLIPSHIFELRLFSICLNRKYFTCLWCTYEMQLHKWIASLLRQCFSLGWIMLKKIFAFICLIINCCKHHQI